MEILLEIIIARFIIRFLGLRTRYLFFKIIGRNKSMENLRGKKKDFYNSVYNDIWNAIIGFIVFAGFSFGIVYLLFVANTL